MSDALLFVLAMNVAAAAAALVVLALRIPVRRLFGASVAYGLWSLVPLAAMGMLLPSRTVLVAAPQAAGASFDALSAAAPGPAGPAAPDLTPFALALWIAGALASLAWLAWRQAAFAHAVRQGCAGPAVVGVLKPRVVTPDDFARRYTDREQAVVLAHEITHIRRHDSRVNAAVAVLRCVNWFNPLVHLAAHYLRIDQELACDAQVVAQHPTARRAYAEAMLKTQIAARPPPLGCYWPAEAAHPLAERIALLARRTPGRARQAVGAAAIAALALAAAGSAWACKPSRVMFVPATPPDATTAPTPEATSRARPVRKAPKPRPAPRPAVVEHVASAADAATDSAVAPASAAAPAPAPAAAPAPSPLAALFMSLPEEDDRRIRPNARPSRVEPGSAVRLIAWTVDPAGNRLTNDITAYGSQSLYRTGSYSRGRSRQALYTSVYQHGERVWVVASLGAGFKPQETGGVALKPGETGDIVLPTGQVVTVTPLLRAETAEEMARGDAASSAAMAGLRERFAARSRERAARRASLAADPAF
jgi:beta-lactamase regulating signal transducer with metallopeptidase domain